MDIKRRIDETHSLTPTEQQLGRTALAMGERMRGTSIKEFAQAANVSVASIHRFCKKLGLEGFKELKIELARAAERSDRASESDVDINFPFDATSTAPEIMARMERLYARTLRETRDMLDVAQVERAAKLLVSGNQIDIYTGSHNLYPAGMFRDRLLSAVPTTPRSPSRTAASPPTSRRSCRSSAAGAPPSSSSARRAARVCIRVLRPISRSAISRACRTASRSSRAILPCSTHSTHSTAAFLPETTPAA